MKFIHLSDLHLGKRVNEYSMLEDQEYILKKIINIVDAEKPAGVIIAGDVYDKSVPAAEAVQLFDNFLVQLAKRKLEVFVISGNHDSPERIAFGSRIMDASGIHMSPVYNGKIVPFSMQDEYGTVDVYMLPFIKPAHVRRFCDDEITTYTDAINSVISKLSINHGNRNILVTHQFVTGSLRSESEEISVGGSDNVDAYVFDPFDYVALGHIHSPQNCGAEHIRYCGTPLKYSFSEAKDRKSVTVIELAEKVLANIQAKVGDLDTLEKRYTWLKALSNTANGNISGKEKVMLETYIQMTYFDRIIARANTRFMIMSGGQYELKRRKEAENNRSQSGLDLDVIDHYNGTERSVKTLSGGESFKASLSLALGLSDEIQASAGGVKLDTMFVDEGFGSLDDESIDQAMKALLSLVDGNRLVGIISHVADLKNRIDKQIVVTKEKSGGSKANIVT